MIIKNNFKLDKSSDGFENTESKQSNDLITYNSKMNDTFDMICWKLFLLFQQPTTDQAIGSKDKQNKNTVDN